MQEIFFTNIQELIKDKKTLERKLNIKLKNNGRLVFIDGEADKEYIALKVLEAMNLGFSVDRALLLTDEDNILSKIGIKTITKRKDIHTIKSRLIGTEGRALRTLSTLSNCAISVSDSFVGIIGNSDDVDEAIIALKSMIHGSKHANVYSRLEKEKKKKKYVSAKGLK